MKDSKGRTKNGFEKHIFVCENLRAEEHPRSCCSEKGGTEIRMKFKEEIKKQGLYGKVRANSAGCLDFCEQGPTLVIYPEGIWYRITDIEKDVKEIVNSHCKNNEIVKRCTINLE